MSGWTRIEDRKPTAKDTDAQGCVLVWHEMNGVMLTGYQNATGSRYMTHWMRVPEGPSGASEPIKPPRAEKFPPALEDVTDYAEARARMGKPKIDPEAYYNFYEANGWVQGRAGKKIKDWRATYRTWEQREKGNLTGPVGYGARIKTVSAQAYKQREYSDEELEAAAGTRELLEEARRAQ